MRRGTTALGLTILLTTVAALHAVPPPRPGTYPTTIPTTNAAHATAALTAGAAQPAATTGPVMATDPGSQPPGHVCLALPVGPPATQPSGVVDGVHRLPLDHGWTFDDVRTGKAYPAIVPGDVHLDLIRNGLIADPFYGTNETTLAWIGKKAWTYRTTFDVPADLLAQPRVELVFDGVDTEASVTLNGTKLGETNDMFLGYRFDAKPLLRPSGNQLRVDFAVPGPRELTRKQTTEYGWDFSPSLVTVGLYRPVRIEAGPVRRIDFVGVQQTHAAGKVTLHLTSAGPITSKLTLGDQVIATGGDTLTVDHPRLWWPNGMGDHPLYDLSVTAADGPSNTWRRRIGLRTIELQRRDEPNYAQSFTFVVNGRPVFVKGANVVPPHVLAGAETPSVEREMVDSAVDANMDMVRVWSGGVFLLDDFYDRADEAGLMVWQEFPFEIYKDSPEYRALLSKDVRYQAERMQSHACVALWCGNNEGELLHRLNANSRPKQFDLPRAKGLVYITQRLMPDVLSGVDPVANWLPSSPHSPVDILLPFDDKIAGDLHEWSVWGGTASPHEYEAARRPRFCSEFGNQSLSSADLIRQFCPPDQLSLTSPTMLLREKSGGNGGRGGNDRLATYAARYGPAKDFDALVYQTQLAQAWSNSVGTRLWRRQAPHCMGSLIWQLNDTWPGSTWSITDFGGHWKPAMYQAKRDYAPALLMAYIPQQDVGADYRWKNARRPVRLTAVYDGAADLPATVRWSLCRIADGSTVRQNSIALTLRPNTPVTVADLDLTDACRAEGDARIYLRYSLQAMTPIVDDTFLFVEPKRLQLARGAVKVSVTRTAAARYTVRFGSDQFVSGYVFDLPGLRFSTSDNDIDLYPHEAKAESVILHRDLSSDQVRSALVGHSLVD